MILEQARDRLIVMCRDRDVDLTQRINVVPLSPDQAIGPEADGDFVIKKGKERVIETALGSARGQAFTDTPSDWAGALDDALRLDLSSVGKRAVLVATMNAVLRRMGMATGTVHCRDRDPKRCGPEMAGLMEQRYGHTRVGLVGLQPAILAGLADRFGSGNVRAVDLNSDNIGTTKSGVPIWYGQVDLPRLIEWCEVGLATGSSITNGTIDAIHDGFTEAGKPVVYFGTTISGPGALLGLDRICPFGT